MSCPLQASQRSSLAGPKKPKAQLAAQRSPWLAKTSAFITPSTRCKSDKHAQKSQEKNDHWNRSRRIFIHLNIEIDSIDLIKFNIFFFSKLLYWTFFSWDAKVELQRWLHGAVRQFTSTEAFSDREQGLGTSALLQEDLKGVSVRKEKEKISKISTIYIIITITITIKIVSLKS